MGASLPTTLNDRVVVVVAPHESDTANIIEYWPGAPTVLQNVPVAGSNVPLPIVLKVSESPSGSSNTLTPGVAFRGFDGDVVLIMFDVYSYQFDSESMSYKIEQAFMHNENDYWMDICRRR